MRIVTKDGEGLTIITEVEPSVTDPAGSCPAIAATYRIVADHTGPTLALVPIGQPVRISSDEFNQVRTIYTVPKNVGQVVKVPKGSDILFY